jgi:4a-hydroxytetrahydrobiopterin dehydratase
MTPSLAAKKISRAQARNATLLNLLATPGLGSLLARRWVAGTGQLVLALAGFALLLVWFSRMMIKYYGLMSGTGAESEETLISPLPLELGGAAFALAWIWSLFTSFSLFRAASSASRQTLESFAENLVKLDEARIVLSLSALPQWQRRGQHIARTYAFADFVAAMKFVNAVADLAEQAQHHPDLDIRWNRVTLTLTTHDAGGLTQLDFDLARQCDALAGR